MKLRIRMPSRTPPQKRYDESDKRFNLALCGRQTGKTTMGYRKLVWKPLRSTAQRSMNRHAIYWHVLQTHAAADIVYERYLRMIHPFKSQILRYKSDTEKRVELIGRNNIFFKSGENFEDLRTESLDGAIVDEARQQSKELFTMVLLPMLAKARALDPSSGWGDILSTTNGFDWLYDFYNDKINDPSWNVIRSPSTEAWWWTPDEINEIKKNMTELEFRQEILAEFVNIRTGKAYVSFGEWNHSTECPFALGKLWSPYHSVVVGMDFNLTPMAWSLGQLAADRWWWFDEVNIQGATKRPVNEEAGIILRDKILAMKDAGYRAEPNLIICGDATGKATQRTSNMSDYDIVLAILKDAGITFRNETPEANPSVKDRVNAVNVKCRDALGNVNLFLHPQYCPHLQKDLDRVAWKEGGEFVLDPGPKKMFGHASDGAGYAIHRLTPPKLIREVGRQRVIQRIL